MANMHKDLVRHSRAGDAFHYRWAARRCLRMIDPKSPLKCITVESSKESSAAGEYVIDLAEYSENDVGQKTVAYFQLKHSTVRTAKAFTLSEIRKTLAGFAKRYSTLFVRRGKKRPDGPITFSFVTNRPVSKTLKQAIQGIAHGSPVDRRIQNKLEQSTKLKGAHLRAFCASMSVADGEGDYIVQRQTLKGEMSEYVAGFVDSQEVDALIAMVADRALPKSEDSRINGEIHPEDVLKRLGVSSQRDLFPAPQEFEKLPQIIRREQHDGILKHIIAARGPTIIHAAGGVGKSVVARQLAESLPIGCRGFLYDCFGGGKYRNPSEPRHRACDALVQMANEMAASGLCRTLIGHAGMPADAIFRAFLERLDQASRCLRAVNENALLVLLVDAADNAELAAIENGDHCFAHALLREKLPSACRLVFLCRTERISLLQPSTAVGQRLLEPFSKAETASHLRQTYPKASDRDCLEFHRLTGGNPRVQANAVAGDHKSADEVLTKLGPGGVTVADQIAAQLNAAVSAIKDRHTATFNAQIESICRGLANLPPFIPLEVLAKAAKVDISTIQSFISDLGRPLWHTDDSVQFRDEPTETWFREKFSAGKAHITDYVSALEPLAKEYTYVAKVLPQLLLKSENYDRLVALALSDSLLPENNPIDQRDIRVYRLQFAFKAALRLGRLADAARLAFRAGEEVASDKRQLELLQANADLVAPLQDAHRIQELAYRQVFRCSWEGSQNVYSASLLSAIKDFHGEARTYLRTARRWLRIYFETRDKLKKAERGHPSFHQEQLKDADIAEFAWAYLNLFGPVDAVEFVTGWKPPEVTFRVARMLIRRLIDAARFEEIDKIASIGAKNLYLMLAVADELMAVAMFPPKQPLRHALDMLVTKSARVPRPKSPLYQDAITPAIESLAEASAARGLSRKKIQLVLDFYAPSVADRSIASDFQGSSRRTFLRGVALRAALKGHSALDPNSLLPPKETIKSTEGGLDLSEDERREITEIIRACSPWHILRARFLVRDPDASNKSLEEVRSESKAALGERYRTYDRLPYEISRVRFEVLALKATVTSQELEDFAKYVIGKAERKFTLMDRLDATRTAFRLKHLESLRARLEESCSHTIEGPGDEGPGERASWFTELARAVLPVSRSDAAAYFDQAIEAVSKFGDEMVERWEAVVAVAKRAAEAQKTVPELAYRFIRCAEVIGNTVAREKYWNRNEVFRVAVHLDAPGAFAALSRWRDRDVGWFDDQLEALVSEAVKAGIVPPVVGWCLSGFQGCNNSVEFAALCIQQEPAVANRQRILNAAIRDLELGGTSLENLKTLEAVADASHLEKSKLSKLIGTYLSGGSPTVEAANSPITLDPVQPDLKEVSWEICFHGINLLTSEGLTKAIDTLNKMEPSQGFGNFWQNVVQRVPVGKESEFLRILIPARNVDSYNLGEALSHIRAKWLKKAAVKREWPLFLNAIGKRVAVALSSPHSLAYWLHACPMDVAEIAVIKNGMIEGLAESLELVEAGTFFGFVGNIANRLTPDEAAGLLNYSLSRFEKHIASDYGDGLWADWLKAPVETTDAVTGLIWAALASPHSAMRWEAAHSVLRLAENSCEREIRSLIKWMQTDGIGGFGSHRFPFYDLHAKLYLLLAFARAAVDNPAIFRPHTKILSEIALEGMPHILIQKTAAEIALSIERFYPSSYGADIIAKLQKVGSSPLPSKRVDGYQYNAATPWHASGQVEVNLKLHFGYDFDRYWFQPLGDLFGVSQEGIVDLAREIAVHSMKIPDTDDYLKDPRQEQWNALDRRGLRGGTWHDHGGYPRVDNYAFYFSYHSYLAVAAKLITEMPVIYRSNYDYQEDRWQEWLKRHSLTRSDGKWLADRRDPTPIKRRKWTTDLGREHWLWGVTADDFFDALCEQNSLPRFLCVNGSWNDCDQDLEETIYITSALVNPESSNSLANALRTCEDSYGFGLPHCGSQDHHLSIPPFVLAEWICRNESRGDRLDYFDPYAREIGYPPDEIEDSVASMLRLSSDPERREWRLPSVKDSSLLHEVWSDKGIVERDEPFRSGERMSAAIDLLMLLCSTTGKDLIFEVRIERRRHRRYGSTGEDGFGYVPPSHKIFILSSNGTLRDKQKSYQLG